MEEAISTAGKWTWIEIANDSIQLEFDDVQLYNPKLNKFESHSSQIAIRFAQNIFFTIYYNRIDDVFNSFTNDLLVNDNIKSLDKPDVYKNDININYNDNEDYIEDIFNNLNDDFFLSLEKNNFKFQSFDFFKKIDENYKFKKEIKKNITEDIFDGDIDFLLCFSTDKIAIAIGGNQIQFFNEFKSLNNQDIEKLSNKWWIYWLDYWKVKETSNSYEYDPACEAIPFK